MVGRYEATLMCCELFYLSLVLVQFLNSMSVDKTQKLPQTTGHMQTTTIS